LCGVRKGKNIVRHLAFRELVPIDKI